MGQYVRSKFIEDSSFIDRTYDSTTDDVYVQCTVEQRTLDSAVSQLQGLFNNTLTYPVADTTYKVN